MKRPNQVTVLGAGIVGVCCARFLQRAGFQVTIVDQAEPGEGCSFGNMAMVCSVDGAMPLLSLEVIRNVPLMLLDQNGPLVIRWRHLPHLLPWLARATHNAMPKQRIKNARALASLLRDSIRAYDDLLNGSEAKRFIYRQGSIWAYETEAAYSASAGEREKLRSLGANIEELSADQLQEREPALAPIFSRAVHLHDCGQTCSPVGLTRALANDIKRDGGVFHNARVTGVEFDDDELTALRTTSETLKVEALVVAAGAWSGAVASWFGLAVPLEAERGYHSTIHGLQVGLRRPFAHGEGNFAITQLEEGLRFGGTVELAGLEAPPSPDRARRIHAQARRCIADMPPDQELRITEWMGCRPTLPDYLPVIGPSPRHKNLWFAFGHQHLGLSLAAQTGQIIGEMLTGQVGAIDLSPFRIDRF